MKSVINDLVKLEMNKSWNVIRTSVCLITRTNAFQIICLNNNPVSNVRSRMVIE